MALYEVSRELAVGRFISNANVPRSIAVEYLKEDDWDVEAALIRYSDANSSEEASVSPSTSQGKGEESNESSKLRWGCEKVLQTPAYAFVLPNLAELPTDFRTFLEKDLIETATLKRLENSGHLNWWCWNGSGQRLWPLSTTGDGNCLLHAASLGMWGIHDRQLMLRNCLHEMLTRGSRRQTLWRRWRWTESKWNLQSGLQLTDEEWHREWNNVLKMADATPRTSGNTGDEAGEEGGNSDQIYASLEGIHVFALAHILKRPIIVVSDTVLRNAAGEELSPISFGGIYLPLECPSSQCHRSPLVLCYDSSHFSALVTMRHASANSLQPVIPITDRNRNLLPLHFSVDPGPDFTWWKDAEDEEIAARIELSEEDQLSLICEYMDIVKIEVRRSSARRGVTGVGNNGRYDDFSKSATLACMGYNENKSHSFRIISEIALLLKKRFKIPGKKKGLKKSLIDVTAADLRCGTKVIAARLCSFAHEYMDHMVENYLYSARQRFEQSKHTPATVSRQRARLSRSFSVSSSNIVCINMHCQQMASQSTNFLCNDCFEYQKQLMTSFGYEQPGHVRSLRPYARLPEEGQGDADRCTNKKNSLQSNRSLKSNTMPLLSGHVPGDASKDAHEDRLHTVAVHNAERPSECITTRVSSVKGANGVTHYYISS